MSAHQRLGTDAKTKLARAQFFGDERVHPGLVSETVLRSWVRSRKCHLQHSSGSIFNHQISPALAKRVRDERRDFLQACAPEIKRLCESLEDMNWLVICTDSEGVIADTGHYGSSSRWSTNPLKTGRILREAEFGTNAPGCVLVERQPIVINRNEHFIDDMKHYVCAAAPILGSRGEIAGVLDITSDTQLLNSAIVEMVALRARAIENRLLAEMWPQFTAVSIHYDPQLVGSPLAGVLVVSPDRRLKAANRAAREMLGINVIPDFGIELQSLFEDPGLFWQRQAEEQTILVRAACLNGAKFYWRASRRAKRMASQRSRQSDRFFFEISKQNRPAEQFVLSDPQARECLELGRRAIRNNLPLVIQGETGSGKEIVARAVHSSWRPEGPFVPLNCGAIREGLIESELFGDVDCAFAGSRESGATGKIASASGGTLFLDEIGEMPLRLQARLLRAIEDRSVVPVGGTRPIAVDISLICATHGNLGEMVRAGSFREDLYYRLRGVTVSIPPLRFREDIDQLIDFLLRAAATRAGAECPLSAEARTALIAYPWPGNVRELQQTLRACFAMAEGAEIKMHHLPDCIRGHIHETKLDIVGSNHGTRPPGLMARMKADQILKTLRAHDGNLSATARALGISRTTIYKHISRK